MDIRNEIPARDTERFRPKALEFSSSARSLVLSMLAAGFEVKRKPDNSFVTSVDLRVEDHMRGLIHLHFPDHGIIGEEYPPANPQAAYQWIMDPIDGTEDFVQHLPTSGSTRALHSRGEPVVGVIDHPLLDIRVSAAFGRGAHYNGRRVTLTDLDPSAIDGGPPAEAPRAPHTRGARVPPPSPPPPARGGPARGPPPPPPTSKKPRAAGPPPRWVPTM